MLRKLRTFQQQIDAYNAEAELDGKELIAIDENPLEVKDHMDELEVCRVILCLLCSFSNSGEIR
jgi:hypothetical protein